MFTIKYRTFTPSTKQPQDGPTNFDSCEQLHGPFDLISQEMEGGYMVVYAHNGGGPGRTFGPILSTPDVAGHPVAPPRPTVWVMNEAGATVGKYDL